MFWKTRKNESQVRMRTLAGEHALAEAERVTQAILSKKTRRVALSVAGLRECDAAGVAALVRMHGALAPRGVRLELEGASDELAGKLWGLGLGRLWGVRPPTVHTGKMVAA
jgi:ABC-type transporter Mla MlaB component